MKTGKSLKHKIKNSLRLMPALRLVWRSSPRWTMTMIVLLVLNSTLPLISIYLSKLIIDTLAAGVTTTHQSAAFSQVLVLVLFSTHASRNCI